MAGPSAPSAALRLSVLDQVPVRSGSTAAAAVAETLQLAKAAEALGYHRYWLAEHHNSGALACASPEVLIPLIAARTSRLRVGSGGVMLPHYSPLKVAEIFRLLETLFPGRIDLGIGRAPGTDPLTAAALAYGRGWRAEQYPQQAAELINYLAGGRGRQPFHRVRATPDGARPPQVWLLGSGVDSALLAAQLGCAYSHAYFINPESTDQALDLYRGEFVPGVLEAPAASLGISAICAESEEEADRLAMSRYLWWIRISQGKFGPFPSVEEALEHPYDARGRSLLEKLRRRALGGDPEATRQQVEELATRHGVDEMVILTITHDPRARLESYRLLAEACGLAAAEARELATKT